MANFREYEASPIARADVAGAIRKGIQAVNYFVHPMGICESETVGRGSRIWAFAHVLGGAQIGEDCNICAHTFIENDVQIGDRVTLKSGVFLWDGLRVGDDVFVGPNATFTNDPFPRSKKYQEKVSATVIEQGASIGANATILPGVHVGAHAMIGAGTVVTDNVPPFAIVMGNPGRITGYVDTGLAGRAAITSEQDDSTGAAISIPIDGVEVRDLHTAVDLRGSMAVGELGKNMPFEPKRFFVLYDVPSKHVRGGHAHRSCLQFLVCVHGSVFVVVDDSTQRFEIELNSPARGILIPPMIWTTHYRYSADAALLVLASEPYDSDDYIRDYDDFGGMKTADLGPN
jgi:UDP-2-acetamido-3-amino-2,3-dideoxy-glucuronate N-acetyltransferase